MSFTLATLRQEVQAIAPWIFPIIGQVSGTSSTAYLTDTTRFTDTNADYLNLKSGVGTWIFRPAATTTERERRVGGNSGTAIDLTNGRIYHGGPVWTGAPSTSDAYEIHAIQPSLTFQMLKNVLDLVLVATLQQVPTFTDSDMETSGVTNYTASNTTLTKSTTATNIYSGTQSQRVLLTGSGGYSRSASFRVIPSMQYFVSSIVRTDVGGPFYLVIYDTTNGAEISSGQRVSSSLEQFMALQRTFQTPAGCEEVQVEILGTASSDDGYWDTTFGPAKGDDTVWTLPTWLNRDANLLKVMTARYTTQYANGVFDARSRQFDKPFQKGRDYQLRSNPHWANPYSLEFRRPIGQRELWMEALRPASDVWTIANTAAGESSPTINLDSNMVAMMWIKNICEAVLANNPNDVEASATLLQMIGAKGNQGPLPILLRAYEKDLMTVQQEPVVLRTYWSTF